MPALLNCTDTQAIFEGLPVPALLLDSKGVVIAFNNAFIKIAGDTSIDGLIGSNTKIMVDHPLKKLVESTDVVEWQSGRSPNRHLRIQRIPLEDAQEASELRLYIDETEKRALLQANTSLHEKLQKNTLTDDATGLLNHRGMILALEPQVARSRRYNRPLTVVLVALDSPSSDIRIWTEVSHLLKDQLRWADLVGVTEDHHFLLALPETNEEETAQLNDKIKQLLIDLSTEKFNGKPISATFGIAGWQKNDNATSMVNRALEQLLALQQEGTPSKTSAS
ncbi:MAG: diguanylate cyclase [Gammaproteobacteria bacterium]